MKIVIPSGIAAALILAAALFFSLQSPRHASAAEDLNAAVQATTAYKGWIKLTVEYPPGLKGPAPNPPVPAAFAEYIHPDGSFTGTLPRPSTRCIPTANSRYSFWSVPPRNCHLHSQTTNEIHLGTMLSLQHQEAIDYATLINRHQMILAVQKRSSAAILSPSRNPPTAMPPASTSPLCLPRRSQKIRQRKQHRISSAPPSPSGSTATTSSHACVTINALTVPSWSTTHTTSPKSTTSTIIGAPVPPRSSTICLTQNIQTLMDRIDARAEKGFGDGTAFITSYGLDDHASPDPSAYAYLFDHARRQWLCPPTSTASSIRSAQAVKNFPATSSGPRPQIGPPPTSRNSSPFCTVPTQPNSLLRATAITAPAASTSKPAPAPIPARSAVCSSVRPLTSSPGNASPTFIWPDRRQVNLQIGIPSCALRHTAGRRITPANLGLHYKRANDPGDGGGTWWLDPTRDDMPVEISWSANDDKGNPTTTSKTTYTDYAQLPTMASGTPPTGSKNAPIPTLPANPQNVRWHLPLPPHPPPLPHPSTTPWFQPPHPNSPSPNPHHNPHQPPIPCPHPTSILTHTTSRLDYPLRGWFVSDGGSGFILSTPVIPSPSCAPTTLSTVRPLRVAAALTPVAADPQGRPRDLGGIVLHSYLTGGLS